MNEVFERTGALQPDRNLFNLSHTFKADVDFGYLYPVLVKKVFAGDVIRLSVQQVMRMNAGVAPFTHEVDIKYWFFFVPNRILDKDGEKGRFESVISGGLKGQEQRDFYRLNDMNPTDFNDFGVGSLSDYLGIIPPSVATVQDAQDNYSPTAFSSAFTWLKSRVEAYPWMAYNKVYIDYFADENLETDKFTNPSSQLFDAGDNFIHTNLSLLHGNWEKDYFTSSLPFQQRGQAPALPVEISGSSIVTGMNLGSVVPGEASSHVGSNQFLFNTNSGGSVLYFNNAQSGNSTLLNNGESPIDISNPNYSIVGNLGVDGSNLVAQTFNVADLRVSIQIQKWMERNARAGVRYTEFLKSHFGVSPTDARLDRAEYLGGTTGHLVVSEVVQTNASNADGDLGDLAGHGLSAFEDGNVIDSYRVEEFGILLGIALIRPKAGYFQGIPREWMYGDRYDWPFPEFAHLSEQAVALSELYATGDMTESQADDVFGFQGRYDELRVAYDRVAGHLRDNLDYWHLARRFASEPQLNEEFIKIDSYADDLHRVFAVEGTAEKPVNPFILTIGFDLSMLRALPFIPEPGLVDHF